MRKLISLTALFGAAALILAAGQPAFAQANKVVASGSKVVEVAPAGRRGALERHDEDLEADRRDARGVLWSARS